MSRAALEHWAGVPRWADNVAGQTRRLVYKPLPRAYGGRQRALFGRCPKTFSLPAVTGDVSIHQWLPPVLDQGGTGSCTGHQAAGCFSAVFRAAGRPLPFEPSPAEFYRNGRTIDRIMGFDGTYPPLADNGAYISSVTRAANVWGCRAMRAPTSDGRNSDADSATINDEPKLDDIARESLVVPVGERAIPDCSQGAPLAAVIDAIRQALANKMPVGFGVWVASEFMNWTPGSVPVGPQNPADPNGGGHAILISDTYTDGSAKVRNSWGSGWGDNGDILVSPDFLATITDITVYVNETG